MSTSIAGGANDLLDYYFFCDPKISSPYTRIDYPYDFCT